MSEATSPIGGILGFPVAPFDRGGRLDEHAFEANIRFLVRSGLDAVFVCAGSGEFQSLSPAEYAVMIEAAVTAADGRVSVFAGTGGNLLQAVKLAATARSSGANGLLILPPYLIAGEQEGLYRYYRTIMAETDLASILYQRDNAVFAVETVERLCDLPQLIGFKDGLGNMELNMELTASLGSRLSWMNGMPFAEITMPAYYGAGFRTYSSALSNYLPHISRLFHQALTGRDTERMNELYRECLLPINRIRKQRKGYAVSLIKAGMEIVGLPVGATVRAPLVEVEKEHYEQLEKVVRHALDRFPAPVPVSADEA